MDRIAIIQLCRFGDIVSILPIAKHLSKDNEVTIICHEDFTGILDACSYVKCLPLSTTHRDVIGAVAKAKLEGFNQILIAKSELNGPGGSPFPTDNYQQQQWARCGFLEKFHDLPLIFDKRNKEFEDKALRLFLPPEDGRPLLGYSLHSISSIYLQWQELEKWIKKEFGKTHRLLNFDLCVGQVHNLLGLIEKCDKLISVDTLHLHLAYSTMTPTVALVQDDPHKRSEPRKHWIENITYSESLTEIGQERIINAVKDKVKLGKLVRSIEVPKILENDNRVAIIELARYGDIVNVLPIAYDLHKKGNEVHWFVHPNFADILEAVSYVKIHKYGGSDRDVQGAADYARKLGFKRVLELQVNGNKLPSPIECENFITQSWARANYLDKFHELPLVFDERNIDFEDDAQKGLPYTHKKNTIAYSLESHSSPMPENKKFEQWIIKEFGDKFNLWNIGALKLKKPQYLIGMLEIASILISIDTLPLHLSYATNTPTIALAPDYNTQNYKERYKWYQSEPRNNWIERVTYTEALEKSGQDKIIAAVNGKKEFGKLCRSFEKFKVDRIVHAVEWHTVPQYDERRRLLSAHKTWENARNSDNSYKLVIVDTDKANRTSKTELGDNRVLPFIHDIIESGIKECQKNDILLLTNSDICLTPEVPTIVRAKLAKYPCCFSRRIDVQNADQPKSLRMIAGIEPHPGTDLFAFRTSWWDRRKKDFPDLLAACEGWDFVFRHIMLWDNPKAQIEPPIIYHELHRAYWYRGDVIKSNPGQLYNRKLCREWADRYGYQDACQPEHSGGLFKLDGTFSRQTPKKN